MIYTSHKEEVYGPIVKEFEARTGIWAEVVTGGTNELLARIAGEADAPVCDVIFGGGVESLTAYERYFQPYACAEADLIRRACAGGRPVDALFLPPRGADLQHQAGLPRRADRVGEPAKRPVVRLHRAGEAPLCPGSSYTGGGHLHLRLPGDDWSS